MRRALTAAVVALALGPGGGFAAEPFDPASRDWDGYAAFVSVLGRTIADIRVTSEARLEELGPRDLLVLIEPPGELPVERIAAWVEKGGQLLVIDESGGGAALADRFGLQRAEVLTSDEGFLGNRALPRLRPVGRHPISAGIDHIVANHPSALRGPGLPVFGTGGNGGVLWDTTLADGRAVFVSDASLFIGLMMPLAGNAQLAANLASYQCESGCSATIVLRGGAVAGAAESPVNDVREAIETLEETLEQLRSVRVDDRALRAGAVLLLSGAVTLLLATMPRLPLARGPRLPAAPGRAPRGEFEFGISRFSGRLRETNFALPAAALADSFEQIAYARLRIAPLGPDADRAAFEAAATRHVERHLTALGTAERRRRIVAVARTLARVANIPRGEAVFTGAEPVDEAAFNTLHAEIRDILREMGAIDEYERRFARPQ